MREWSMEEAVAIIDRVFEVTQAIIFAFGDGMEELYDVDENEAEYAYINSEED